MHMLPFLAVGGKAAVGAATASAAVGATGTGMMAMGVAAPALSVSTMLAGGSSLAGAVSSIAGGFAQSNALKQEAYYMDAQARQAEIEGRRDAVMQLENLNRSLASQVAAIGASGIGYSGSPVSNVMASEKRGAFDIELTKAGTEANVAVLRARANQTRRAAKQSVVGGFLGAGADLAQFGLGRAAQIKGEKSLLGLRR